MQLELMGQIIHLTLRKKLQNLIKNNNNKKKNRK